MQADNNTDASLSFDEHFLPALSKKNSPFKKNAILPVDHTKAQLKLFKSIKDTQPLESIEEKPEETVELDEKLDALTAYLLSENEVEVKTGGHSSPCTIL